MAKRHRSSHTNKLPWLGAPWLAAAATFFLVCLGSESTAPGLAAVLALVGGLAAVLGLKRLRERMSLPMAALTVLVLWSFIASLYAQSGAIAKLEIVKIAASFGLVLLLLLAGGEEQRPGMWLAAVLAGAAALISLVSIDLLSTRLLSGLFSGVMGLFSQDYALMDGVEAGVRMTSLVGNPNVFAGCAGIGVLLSLGLVGTADKPRAKTYALCCLYVNALGFVLAFSMGGTAMIALGFCVFLLLERKGQRADLLVTMLYTLALTLLGVFVISATSLQTWDGFDPVPLLVAAAGAAGLCLADRFAAKPVTALLTRWGKGFGWAAAGAVAIVLVFAVFACTVTGPAELEAGETLRRAVKVTGDCTLELDCDGAVTVRAESQNANQIITHTAAVLYEGDAEGAAFSVGADSEILWLEFTAPQGAVLRSVTCGGADVPLDYLLLPGFIANRLQGLWANQNAVQRLAFFADGMKLFRRSPVVGLGLGSFENSIFSVQPFYYEAKHTHNHYIQLLADMGIVGLGLFLCLLFLSGRAVLRARRRENGHPMAPALGAALVFMAGHAAVEVVFSIYLYLPFAYGVFALTGLLESEERKKPGLRTGTTLVSAAVAAAMAVVLLISGSAADAAASSPTPQTMIDSAKKDCYNWSDYAKSYLRGAPTQKDNPQVMAQADAFALRLTDSEDRNLPIDAAVYYFQTEREELAFDALRKTTLLNRSDPITWAEVFAILAAYESDSAVFAQGARELAEGYGFWTRESLAPVETPAETVEFLNRVCPGWDGVTDD